MPFTGPASSKFSVETRFTTNVGAEVPVVGAGHVFVGGGSTVSKLDLTGAVVGTISAPALPAGQSAAFNSVAFANGVLAIAYGVVEAATGVQLPGIVRFHDATSLALLNTVTVGATPDNIVFTPDGQKLLVANEAEPNSYGRADSFDPEGSISIIDISAGVANATVQTAGFTAFNGQAAALRAEGVRIYGPGATVAQDLEPEYIAISADGSTAYVTLQENNALAIVDIASATVTDIAAFGLKNHNLPGQGLDAGDRDGPGNTPSINIKNWSVFGMYQPDAITTFQFNGQTFLATANEGDARDYAGFSEEVRVGAASYVLDPTAFPNAAALKTNAEIGRLTVTNASGNPDGDGDFDQIQVFGARSFSVWDTAGNLVWDSGDAIEQAIAALDPSWLAPTAAQLGTLAGLGDDTRSDNKGPEPEHIAFGKIGNELYAFVGLERAGAVMLFDLNEAAATPSFSFAGVFQAPGDVAPEVFTIVQPSAATGGKTGLVVANEVSNTLTWHDITPANYKLQILHSSDQEAGLLATGRIGNYAAIFDKLEDEFVNSITLSTGDAWIPGPFYAAEADPALEAALEAFYGVNLPGGAQFSGRVSLAVMNAIGTDAASFGNHEFDLGTRAIRDIIAQSGTYPGAQFPYLSANLDFSGDTALTGGNLAGLVVADGQEASSIKGRIAGTAVITEGGEKIGLVGATTQVLASLSSPGAVTVIGDDLNDMPQLAAILQPKIDALIAQGINKIIVMSHLQQFALEQALTPLLSGIDIVISSGNHSLFADAGDPLRGGDVPVSTYPVLLTNLDGDAVLQVNSTSEYAYVNRLVVEFDAAGRIVPSSVDPAVSGVFKTDDAGVAAVWGADVGNAFAPGSKGARADALADAVQNVISTQDGTTFGFSDVFLDGKRVEVRQQETNLGSLTADANLWYAKQADSTVTVSIKNGGGIRDSIGSVIGTPIAVEGPTLANPDTGKEAGEISQLDIVNSLRFNNTLTLLTVSADELLQVLEHAVRASTATNTPGQFAQISGINFSWDLARAPGDRVLNATIVDEDGTILDVIARDGALVGDAVREIRLVTLNFLAGGGDSYPFNLPGFGADRVDLLQAGVRNGVALFADEGTEQDAFAEFLAARHATRDTAYDALDTEPLFDTRIQKLGARLDTVEPELGFELWREFVGGNGADRAAWRSQATNLDYTNGRVAGEQMSSSMTDSTGAALARFLAGDGDVSVRQVDFARGTVGGATPAMTIDWQGREAVVTLNTAWSSIRTFDLTEFSGDALTVQNFVMVAAELGPDGDARPDLARDLTIQGARRADIKTGDAGDRLLFETDTASRGGDNLLRIATHGGDDVVEIRASGFDWAAGEVYDPRWTESQVDLGAGDDVFLGGDGTDRVRAGAGDDVLDGRGGFDVLLLSGRRADYSITVLDAATGLTRISGLDGVDEVMGFERIRFDLDWPIDFKGSIWGA
jgi:2',3'-cyclic-nucleotide 2'-phosphodiesterase / 3'-nucleotidase / 5'-nucleotidase